MIDIRYRREFRLLFGRQIDFWIARATGLSKLDRLQVCTRTFSEFRLVDVFRAAERYSAERGQVSVVDSEHYGTLNQILNGRFPYNDRHINGAERLAYPVGCREQEYLPTSRFWAIAQDTPNAADSAAVIRVRRDGYSRRVLLEVAAETEAAAQLATDQIVQSSIEQSIYRGQVLQVGVDAGVTDETGDMDPLDQIRLHFQPRTAIGRDEIVLDEETHHVLERNILRYHQNRERLRRHRVPSKKGLLFYGPPGTGKTYTCRYLYSQLAGVTTFIVTGKALAEVKSVCNLARMLQPSLVIMEDVDLIFTAREINLYSTALGDLLDEMDGFHPHDAVMFLLTTNAIERLERAIKDRPGRISQCVYFGPPHEELRSRYILQYLEPYESDSVDIDRLVELTDGCTQAFLKELVYRAVCIALESTESETDSVVLRNLDFERAYEEMTRYDEKSTQAILGFAPVRK